MIFMLLGSGRLCCRLIILWVGCIRFDMVIDEKLSECVSVFYLLLLYVLCVGWVVLLVVLWWLCRISFSLLVE